MRRPRTLLPTEDKIRLVLAVLAVLTGEMTVAEAPLVGTASRRPVCRNGGTSFSTREEGAGGGRAGDEAWRPCDRGRTQAAGGRTPS